MVESAAYGVVLREALDASMHAVTLQLHQHVYHPPNSPPREGGRSPPLASLLPQMKALVGDLLPEKTAGSAHFKTLAAGPLLDSLCFAVLDAREN